MREWFEKVGPFKEWEATGHGGSVRCRELEAKCGPKEIGFKVGTRLESDHSRVGMAGHAVKGLHNFGTDCAAKQLRLDSDMNDANELLSCVLPDEVATRKVVFANQEAAASIEVSTECGAW